MNQKTTQVRVGKRSIVEGHAEGTILWMEPLKAAMLAKAGAVHIIGSAAPQESKPAGPAETQDLRPKSLVEAPTGPSTASAPSGQSGPAKPSFVSAAVRGCQRIWSSLRAPRTPKDAAG